MMATTEVPVKTFTQRDATKPYSIPLGNLRAFITALVVAHHAVLAYHPYAPPPGASLDASPWWRAFPVVDTAHSGVFTVLAGFNDVFFMSLMFLLSGVFVWNSLQRKGTGKYLRDRLVRLGVPFVAAVVIVAPLAYYPSYLQSKSHPGFVKTWLSLSGWPSGPAWFIWVLLVFGLIAAMLTEWSPKWAERFGSRLASTSKFFAILLAISAATYVPLAVIFDPMSWSAFGPFVFQTSRILHYLAYFLIGVALGACGIAGALPARRWLAWTSTAVVAFLIVSAAAIAAITNPAVKVFQVVGDFGFVICCAASCFAFLAIFLRFATNRMPLFDSLRDNAYGMYLVHYAFVTWLQYALLSADLPGLAKGTIVFAGALALSWVTTAALRRIPAVARVI